MAYDKDTPLNINESFSVSQPKITANFQEIDTFTSVDHESFGTANQGKHKHVLLTEQVADVSTVADEMVLYAKDNAGTPNTYLRLENNGTIFNMTPSVAGHAASGAEILPSGLKMIWGTASVSGDGTVVVFADGGFPTVVYQVTITRNAIAGDMGFASVLAASTNLTDFKGTSYDEFGNNSTVDISYFAIGK